MLKMIRWVCVLGSALLYFVVIAPQLLSATPPQCDGEVCTSDSVACDEQCGIGNTVTTCIEYMEISENGECNIYAYQLGAIGNHDMTYSGEPTVDENNFWDLDSAMDDAVLAGLYDGTISGATAALDVLASYGFMPESSYYIDWADDTDYESSGVQSMGFHPQGFYGGHLWFTIPSCAVKQAKLDDLSKASRGAWWGAALGSLGAVVAGVIPGGQLAAIGSGASGFAFGVAAAELGDRYNFINDHVPCIPQIAGT